MTDFGPLAATYDRLRPADASWQELLDVIWEEGDLAGRRVLDVGCGTGRHVEALAERGAATRGVDPSEAMLAEARGRRLPASPFVHGAAESLPFVDRAFERALLHLVVHLVDRERALPEVARVLVPGGRVVIATFRPEHFERFYVGRLFPSLARIDRERFPAPAVLAGELARNGFEAIRIRSVDQERTVGREEALERLRGRYISTLRLLPEDEYQAGLERAEHELDEEMASPLAWAVIVADRSGRVADRPRRCEPA